jgi:hypothetical protein
MTAPWANDNGPGGYKGRVKKGKCGGNMYSCMKWKNETC